MENGQFEQVFSVQKSGFPPFLRPSSFARTSRLSRGRAGPPNANNERDRRRKQRFFIPETASENTWQKTRLLFLVLGPVHSTENDCQH